MTCENIKPKLRDYLDDQLPEGDRGDIRSHLKECRACRDYSFAFSSFGTDLRRFAALEPDPELKEKVLESFQTKVPATHEASSNHARLFLWIGLVILLVLVGSGLGWLFYDKSVSSKQKSAVTETAETPAQDLLPLPTDNGNPLNSSKYAISLRPFHWDVEFSSLEKRNMFLVDLRERYGTIVAHFESPSFLVFSASKPALKEVLNLLIQLGAGINGGKTLPSHIPDYADNVRISLALGTPQSRISRTLSHHWHFKFELPNKFTLKEKFLDLGGRMLYEAPEIWIMEINGRDFEFIHEVIRGTHGLTTNIGEEQFLSTESYANIKFRITIYLEEG